MNIFRLLSIGIVFCSIQLIHPAAGEPASDQTPLAGLLEETSQQAYSACSAASAHVIEKASEYAPLIVDRAAQVGFALADGSLLVLTKSRDALAYVLAATYQCCSRCGHVDVDIKEDDDLGGPFSIHLPVGTRSVSVVRRRSSSHSEEERSTPVLAPVPVVEHSADSDRTGLLDQALEDLDCLMFGSALEYFNLQEEAALQAENAQRILERLENMASEVFNEKEKTLYDGLLKAMKYQVKVFTSGFRPSYRTARDAALAASERIATAAQPARSATPRRRRP